MNNQIICFNLSFKHSGVSSGKKSILSVIDQYLDYLEEIGQILVRHYGYIIDGSRKLKNISSEIFEYQIRYRLIPPLQLFLDNQISDEKMVHWIVSVIRFLNSEQLSSYNKEIDNLAYQANLNESFFYVPFPVSLISKKIDKFQEISAFLDEKPVTMFP